MPWHSGERAILEEKTLDQMTSDEWDSLCDGCSRFHGVFAPNFKHRQRIVPRRGQGRVDADKPLAPMTWVQRLKRVFAIDIETCPGCDNHLLLMRCYWLLLAELRTKHAIA